MSTEAKKHAEWLALIDISGPFLSLPVLMESFPQGLERSEQLKMLRPRVQQAYEEWADSQVRSTPDAAIHQQWLRFVLEEVLAFKRDTLLTGQQIPEELHYDAREHGEMLRPQLLLRSPYQPEPRLLIELYPHQTNLNKALPTKHWKASPATRMMELLRHSGVRLGLITNGQQWMLIDAPANETTGYYSWDALLWSEEPVTLQAFRTLLGMERFFNVPDHETLESLLTKSAEKQQEVTSQLGKQVLSAVETLVHTLDQLDKEDRRVKQASESSLLTGVSEKELYEAALTVMMRLVFLLSAEERGMLLLGERLYDENYAVSTLLKQLQEQGDQQGEEVMGYRCDAWSRLLAAFRVVYGGIEHMDLRLRAYGGRLFDPDRYPFLEGRPPGTGWRETLAHPLKIDNRTVLHLLNALQFLQQRIGGSVEPRRLSFRGLDIEQIGHVYEGLLDHTARRAESAILNLLGSSDREPEITLEELERLASKGESALLTGLHELTGRSLNALQKSLQQSLEKQQERSRLMGACDNKQRLFERILPFVGLVRRDTFDDFMLVTPGSLYVTKGTDRRASGTHYTPRSLTEPIVQHALDPLVYIGPAEGLAPEEWRLRTPAELLDLKICDMAMGSGAFLVQSCRYLSEKLAESWEHVEHELNGQRSEQGLAPRAQITPEGKLTLANSSEEFLPADSEERQAVARRLISERCLYGVDKNPMAVEMAKLSLWLITLAKNKPFTFLDHNLRSGDSLLGADERQLENGSLDARSGEVTQMSQIRYAMQMVLPTVIHKRRQIATLPDFDIAVVQEKGRLLHEAEQALQILKLGADTLIGIALSEAKGSGNLQATLGLEYVVLAKGYDEALNQRQTEVGWSAKNTAFHQLRAEVDGLLKGKTPFHWPLEFPEVFVGKGDASGFSAMLGNPPFQGGQKITGVLGTDYRDYLVKHLADGKRGSADLCAYFFLKTAQLVRKEGMGALLATNTIAQGDTREVGLDQLTKAGWSIPRAIQSRKWPGAAGVEVAHVWLRNGSWHGSSVLGDKVVDTITPLLTASGKTIGNPYPLLINSGKSFQGSIVLGMGFILENEEAQALIERDIHNKEVLFPYIGGEDVTTQPDQSPSRWVINFHDWPLDQAEAYSECMQIIRAKIKPERDLNHRKVYKERWWHYAEKRPALYKTIKNMQRVLVIPQVSKYMLCAWEPTGFVYSQKICVIATEANADLALIQSTFHDNWTRLNGSTMRNDQNYSVTDCFETFPFPLKVDGLDAIGESYNAHRQAIMLARQEGLTKIYNRFHEPRERAEDIVRLRVLHQAMDEAVARAYGWDDLALAHGFHETRQGLRFTISEAARRDVLDRLLLLNHQRHAEEVQAGLVDEQGKPLKKTSTMKDSDAKSGRKSKNRVISRVMDANVEDLDNGLEQNVLF